VPPAPRASHAIASDGIRSGTVQEVSERAQPTFPPYSPRSTEPVEVEIDPPEALGSYFRKLTLVDLGRPGTIARTGHWGDSVLGVDGITSGIRRRLQSRFGDAGHGFHLMDRYHPAYLQRGITFRQVAPWERCFIVWDCRKDERRYGYGGLLAYSSGGSESAWSTPKEGFGQSVTRFELWYARQERGGRFDVVLDGERTESVDTRGPELEDAWFSANVPAGPHSFRVRAAGRGSVRAYGVVLENDGPGVVWDGVALVGGSTRALRTQRPEHIESQIRRRDPDLIAFMLGGNDLERNYVDLKESMQPYYDEYRDVLRIFRAGKPELACLIISPIDHGRRLPNGDIVPKSFLKPLVEAQREVARQNGCAFFDTYRATGGEGTAARWFRARPRLISPDLGHPTEFGHEVIAGLIADAILSGYEQYRARMQGKPLPELVGHGTSGQTVIPAEQPLDERGSPVPP
jgi:lysophospholipase L1-like esterase